MSLAALQCHARKGLTIDSPRLKGTADWLKGRAISSPQFISAPLRLAASATIRIQREAVINDIEATLSLVNRINQNSGIDKPIVYMLALDALIAYEIIKPNHIEMQKCCQRLKMIVDGRTELPSVRAYAACLLTLYGTDQDRIAIESFWQELFSLQHNGAWKDCIVETSYVLLNICSAHLKIKGVTLVIAEAIDFLRSHSPEGVPQLECIRHTPRELGNNPPNLQVYAAAIETRALVETLGNIEEGCLQFAHASWKLEQDELSDYICQLKTDFEKERSVFRKALLKTRLGFLFCFVALAILAILNPAPIERFIGAIGSIASIVGFVSMRKP